MVSPGKTGRIRYDWWRAHHGLPGHPKWRAVARTAQVPVSVAFHIVMCLLDTASRGQPRGSIGDFKPFDCAGIVDVPVDKVDRVVEVLRDIHWLEGHMVSEWDGRQPQREDANAARRAAEFRSRHKSVTLPVVTQSKCDDPDRSRNESVTTEVVTPANAPEGYRDKSYLPSFGTTREEIVEKLSTPPSPVLSERQLRAIRQERKPFEPSEELVRQTLAKKALGR